MSYEPWNHEKVKKIKGNLPRRSDQSGKILVIASFIYRNTPFLQRVIQRSTLEDTNVPDKAQWDNAIKFMEKTLQKEQDQTQKELADKIGPGWQERWLYWSYRNHEQVSCCCCDRFFMRH